MLLTAGLSARGIVFDVGDLGYDVISAEAYQVSVIDYFGETADLVIPEKVEYDGLLTNNNLYISNIQLNSTALKMAGNK